MTAQYNAPSNAHGIRSYNPKSLNLPLPPHFPPHAPPSPHFPTISPFSPIFPDFFS